MCYGRIIVTMLFFIHREKQHNKQRRVNMKNLDQLKRQHVEIFEVLNNTKSLIQKKDLENDSMAIAKNINNIAGKLQVHLNNEDRFLYPAFLKSESAELKTKAQAYSSEMGDLSSVYTDFKTKYNTRSKIMADSAAFLSDAKTVFDAIEKRIEKEDHDLYKLAEKL